ncbi:MAG: NADH-quinone oxidoreductase subunit NuoN [Dehalococcoidia bacterium]|nr:NADH-quinone oxidoreductase subunit NuoN [Dehalococcoidia bacterium]
MLDDLDRIGPVLVMAGVAALIIIWDFIPRPLPAARGKPLLFVALLGPAAAAAWTVSLLLRDAHIGCGPLDPLALSNAPLCPGGGGTLVEGVFSFANSVVLDDLTIFFFFLFAGIGAAIILASNDYAKRFGDYEAEFYALILFATSAMLLLSASRDLILIFVALEMTGITQYILAALQKDRRSTEAGIKYLLLGATASAVILYGMAFLFGLTGTTRLVAPGDELSIASVINERGGDLGAGLIMSLVFLIGGLSFKMSVVPFQMWAPDVYEGAPAPVAAFLSVASKAAAFAVVLRIFFEGLSGETVRGDWADIFAIVAAVSMTVGNVFALVQSNIKRLLGYSSIAQAGNFMVGLAAVSAAEGGLSLGASGVLFFIAAYAFTNLGAFIVVIAISARIGSDQIADYAGLARRAPLLAAALAFALISLTGIPPTAGFIAKLYIFNAAVESNLIWLVVVAVLNSVVSAFYYLKVAGIMFMGESANQESIATSAALKLVLGVAVIGILFVGIVPSPLLDAARDAASVFSQ